MSIGTLTTIGLAFLTLSVIINLVVIVSKIIIETIASYQEVDHLTFKEQLNENTLVAVTFVGMVFFSFGLVAVSASIILQIIIEQ